MTIIQTNKRDRINYWTVILLGVLMFAAISGVLLNNLMVNFKHESSQVKNSLRDVEVKNAELKNQLHKLTSTRGLDLAQSGMILEKNPEYVRGEQLVVNN